MTPDLTRASDRDTLATLFDLGRRVTSVLHLDELLPRIPELIGRLISFDAFAVYLLDDSRETLRVAWSVGYAEDTAVQARLQIGEGLVGVAVAEREPLLSNDVSRESRYVELVPGMHSEIVVPLLYKGEPIGALNILSRETNAYAEEDVPILRQFAVHVAVAIENARLFERQISDAHAFETLAEIGRDFGSILDLDELLARIGQLTRRLITYRTFGILLLDEASGELEMRLALQYGERLTLPRIKVGEGLVGYSALNKEAVNVPDVTVDPRYIKLVDDVRSELAIPMLIKDRCIGVVDLESPEFNAFGKRDVEILTLLAAQAAVAIENARLYAAVRANEERLERELRFAERVQTALLPTGLAKRQRGVEVASRFSPARELGGDFYDFLAPEPNSVVVAVGDVSGKGVPAALYSAFAGEIVRSLTFRRRYTPERATPSAVLASMNTILYERQLEGYYCTLIYASFDLKRRQVSVANSGMPYVIRSSAVGTGPVELPGIPLGVFPGSSYEEVTLPLSQGDVFVFCSDGVFDTFNESQDDFGVARVVSIVDAERGRSPREIIDAVVRGAEEFRGGAGQGDDFTIVAVKITN